MRKYKLQFLFFFMISLFYLVSCSNASDSSSNTNDSEFGIKYSFYLSSTTDQPWATVNGLEGSVVPTVNSPEKRGNRFTGWKTKSGDSIPAVFGKDELKFYAQWVDINTVKLIGSKSAPDTVGDVIFTDGSASPYPEDLKTLTEEQWTFAVAMLFTTTYNPTNGQNVKGGQYQYKIAAGLVMADNKAWCVDKIIENISKGVQYDNISASRRLYTSLYIGYYWEDNSYVFKKFLTPFSLSSYFGRQNFVDSKKFLNYATDSITPAFSYAVHYGEKQKIDSDFKEGWYIPSAGELKILLQDESIRNRYNRIIQKKAFADGTASDKLPCISEKSYFWTSTTDTSQSVNDGDDDWVRYSGENGNNVYYGIPSTQNNYDKNAKVLMFDPYTGEKGLQYLQINPHYQSSNNRYMKYSEGSKEIWPKDGSSEQYEGPGYVYRYVFYTKAYKMNYQGVTSFDEKTVKLSVIPVKVF